MAEDVYLIKPNNSPDKKVEIAVTHLSPLEGGAARPAIILLHGSYQNRRLWFTPGVDGLAKRLLIAGYDIWLMEQRGHGLSPLNQRFENNTLGDYARYDIPAVNTFVAEQTGGRPHWLGCNEGAAAVLLSLTAAALDQSAIASVVGLGQPLALTSLSCLPGAHWLPALLSGPIAHRQGLGPEREPMALCKQVWRERSVFSYFGAQLGVRVAEQLDTLPLPLAWIQAQGQKSLTGLGSAVSLEQSLQLLPCHLAAASLHGDSLAETMADVGSLDAIMAPLVDFLREQHGVLSAGKTSSAA